MKNPYYIYCKDPLSEDLSNQLSEIPTCPGVCIFLDLVGSTRVKYKEGIESWGKKLNNTFNFFSFLNDFPDHFVKGIGDEIMLYIPDELFHERKSLNDYYALLEEIYATVDNITNFPIPDLFFDCKVSIHYCTDVYNITFFKGLQDYYGIDIDISARLMSKATSNRIVLSEVFYQKAKEDFEKNYDDSGSLALSCISEKYIEDFKGVPESTAFRVIDIRKDNI